MDQMNFKEEYKKFIEKYPSYAKDIMSYEEGEGNSLKLYFKNGKTALYFPPYNTDYRFKKSKNKSKQSKKTKSNNNSNNKDGTINK